MESKYVNISATALPSFQQVDNITTTNTSDVIDGSSNRELPLIGYPGPGFSGIHVTALVCLSISTVVSSVLLCYLCGYSRHQVKRSGDNRKKQNNGNQFKSTPNPPSDTTARTKYQKYVTRKFPFISGKHSDDNDKPNHSQNNQESSMADGSSPFTSQSGISGSMSELDLRLKARGVRGRSFWKWNVGERMVVYLAICDLGYSTTDIVNHAYIYFKIRHPPDLICAAIGFLLHGFTCSQTLVVLFTAVIACTRVVFNRRMNLGRWDHRLISVVFGLPGVIGSVCAMNGVLGQSGAWCLFDLRNPGGKWYVKQVSIMLTTVFFLLSITYAAIWIKISQTARQVNRSWTDHYQNSARIMMLFVVVYIVQYWSTVMYSIWSWIEDPPPTPVFINMVAFVTSGGVYNLIAYTVVRRKLLNANKPGHAVQS